MEYSFNLFKHMNTQIKLILRALLPLLFIGANRIGQRHSPSSFHPGRCRSKGRSIVPRILLFFFPIILLIHGCICYINQRHKFNLKRLAYALAILSHSNVHSNLFPFGQPHYLLKYGKHRKTFLARVILWLYLYGMNTTRQVNVPEWNSKSGVAWFCISLCLIVEFHSVLPRFIMES